MNDEQPHAALKEIILGDRKKFDKTFEGEVYRSLREEAALAKISSGIETKVHGRTEYFFGKDDAVIQVHSVGGSAEVFTRALDLKKPWWHKVLVERGLHGKLDTLDVIFPSILELMRFMDPEHADQWKYSEILRQLGIKSDEELEEYEESDLYSKDIHAESIAQKIVKSSETFFNPLLAPHFSVEFSNGKGDIKRKLRLVPETETALNALITNDDGLLKEAVQKLLDHYDAWLAHLKKSLKKK